MIAPAAAGWKRMLGGPFVEKQIYGPPEFLSTPSEVVVSRLTDSLPYLWQIGILGNAATVPLCGVPLVTLVSIPVIVIRDHRVQQRKPQLSADRDVSSMRTEHRL
jgi:hypothetical protein